MKIILAVGIVGSVGFGFLGRSLPSTKTAQRWMCQTCGDFDSSRPFTAGPIRGAVGFAYEDEVRLILKESGYEPHFGSGYSLKIDGELDLDVLCAGNHTNWGKLTQMLSCHFICDPPSQEPHALLGECKLSSSTLTDWVDDPEQRGISKLFNSQKVSSGGIKCVFVNGGRKSKNFVESLNDQLQPSSIAIKLRMDKVNVFYSPYLSSESVEEVQAELLGNQIRLSNLEHQFSKLEVKLKSGR